MSEYLPLSHSEDKSTSCGSEALSDDDLRALQIHERERSTPASDWPGECVVATAVSTAGKC